MMIKQLFVIRSIVLPVIVLAVLCTSALAQESQPWSVNTSPLPPSTGYVNDIAGVMDAATKQQLETKLRTLKETSSPSVEIAVAVVKTTGGRDIFDYSLAVARGWKIGSKEDDNPSALLFVAIDDRKYFTQVSKDLEDELPDGIAGSLQRQYLVPEFKKGNYSKGISDTIDAYIERINAVRSGTVAKATPTPAGQGPSAGLPLSTIFCCAVILLVLLLIIFSRSKGGPSNSDRNRWGGGGFGGGGALPWIIGGILSSGGGSGSSSSDWGGGSSGGWGGFGGGGDFGGGGAGGDW